MSDCDHYRRHCEAVRAVYERYLGERDKAVSVYHDLYLEGRATRADLRASIRGIGLEGGPAFSRGV